MSRSVEIERAKGRARWLGWLELCAAPLFVAAATTHRAPEGSGQAANLWMYSMPVAAVFFALPGALLLTAPRLGWMAQVLPALLLLGLVALWLTAS